MGNNNMNNNNNFLNSPFNQNDMNNMNNGMINNMMNSNQLQQQMMQQQEMMRQQMLAQQQAMAQAMMQQQALAELQSKVEVIFHQGNHAGNDVPQFLLKCSRNDKVSSMIEKYRNLSGDRNPNKKFIFKARKLNGSLTLAEVGITNKSNVFVI